VIRFAGGLSCPLFSHETGVVLHAAAVWSSIARVNVAILRLQEADRPDMTATGAFVSIDLETEAGSVDDRENLARYLLQALRQGFGVHLVDGIVRVEWFGPPHVL